MRKLTVPLLATLLLLAVPGTAQAGTHATGGADARRSTAKASVNQKWSDWAYTPSAAGDATGLCAEPIHLAFPVDRVEQRRRLIPGGSTEIESKGKLVVTITPTSQPDHHYTFDISGPSTGKNSQIAYVNGDYLYRATGASLLPAYGTAVDNSGLPRLAYTRGAVGVLYAGSVKGDVITRPKTVIDVCKYMGLDSAP
jgi:hypothetical protein